MKQLFLVGLMLSCSIQMVRSQGYLVDRTADQVGLSYNRQSSSNTLGAMYGHSFDGIIDAGIGLSRIFTSPSFSNFAVSAFGDYYILKQGDEFPLTLSAGLGATVNIVSSATITSATPNITAYYKADLEDFIVQPFVNYGYTRSFSDGRNFGSNGVSVGANFAFPGDQEAFFVFTPSVTFGDGSSVFGVRLRYILPAKNDPSSSAKRPERVPDITVPTESVGESDVNEGVSDRMEDQNANNKVNSDEDGTPRKEETMPSSETKEQMGKGQQKNDPLNQDPNIPTVNTNTRTEDNPGNEEALESPKTKVTAEKGRAIDQTDANNMDGQRDRNLPDNQNGQGAGETNKSGIDAFLDDSGVYFVQIAALSRTKGSVSDFRKALFVGSLYRKPTSLNYKIRVGKFQSYEEAQGARQKLMEFGFTDAFIVQDANQAFYELMDYE